MGALAATVVRLIRTFHGYCPSKLFNCALLMGYPVRGVIRKDGRLPDASHRGQGQRQRGQSPRTATRSSLAAFEPLSPSLAKVQPTRQHRDPTCELPMFGGEGGIRTLGPLTRSTVFETAPFNHSGTSPRWWNCFNEPSFRSTSSRQVGDLAGGWWRGWDSNPR